MSMVLMVIDVICLTPTALWPGGLFSSIWTHILLLGFYILLEVVLWLWNRLSWTLVYTCVCVCVYACAIPFMEPWNSLSVYLSIFCLSVYLCECVCIILCVCLSTCMCTTCMLEFKEVRRGTGSPGTKFSARVVNALNCWAISPAS